jgi:hypothetical protein
MTTQSSIADPTAIEPSSFAIADLRRAVLHALNWTLVLRNVLAAIVMVGFIWRHHAHLND